jgi:hypothetical protein
MRWVLLALVLVGCGAEHQPCADRYHARSQVEAAWNEAFAAGPCPCVSWVRQAQLDCNRLGPGVDEWVEAPRGAGMGWIASDTTVGRTCVTGLSDVQDDTIWAITPADVAHEFVHHWIFRRTGDGDGLHTSSMWQPGRAVDKALTVVRAARVTAP